jgi:exopolysaccharide production protein ExoQ
MTVVLVSLSGSKTALGLALIAPFLAGLTLITRMKTRISPAIILLSIPLGYAVLSHVDPSFNVYRLAYALTGDSTFTGRVAIWDFVQSQIALRPLLGWGYQSFWLIPDSPAFEAPWWISRIPEGHSGYYDTTLEMGYIGYTLLIIFIFATLHAVGRVADRDPVRAWLVLSLALFIIGSNYLESLWMRGQEFLWVVFLIIAAEIARYWYLPLTGAASRSRTPGPVSPGPSRGTAVTARKARL